MADGLRTTTLDTASLVDEFIANRNGGTVAIPVDKAAAQLLATTAFQLLTNAGKIFQTYAALAAATVGDFTPWVYADPDPSKNGIYRRESGAWVWTMPLPYSFIKASNSGSGTPSAIQATTGIPVSEAALIILPIAETNDDGPVTVSFNGQAALTIKSNNGNDIVEGGLVAGMQVIGSISGTTFRILSDQISAAIVAQAETWAAEAGVSAGEAADSADAAALSAADAASAAAAQLTSRIAKAGDTMTGRLGLKAGTTGSAPLLIPDGVAPSSPTDGEIWRRDAGGGLFLRKGASSVKILDSQAVIRRSFAIIADQKAQGTAGQSLPSAAWTTRDLNTELADADGIVSISSNQFTVTADCTIQGQAMVGAGSSQVTALRLYSVTDAAVVQGIIGAWIMSLGAITGGANVAVPFSASLTAGKTYRFEGYASTGGSTGGAKNQSGMSEYYLIATIERLQHVIN